MPWAWRSAAVPIARWCARALRTARSARCSPISATAACSACSPSTASRPRTSWCCAGWSAADGRSRAFVNDQPISSGLLRQLGELLVEVHGQHEQQALLEPAVQRALLDHHGRLAPRAAALRAAWQDWRTAEESRAALAAEVERAAGEEAYWRHVAGRTGDARAGGRRGGDAGRDPRPADEPREAPPGARRRARGARRP